MKIKFKHKVLLGTIGLTILAIAIQCGMQFVSSYKFVGFAKRDDSSWAGIAGKAQAEKVSCLDELDQLKATLKDMRSANENQE